MRLVFDAAPGPGVVLGIADLGDRFRLVANEIEVVAPDEPLPRLPVARAVWKPAPDLRHLGRGLADRRRPAPHRAVHGGAAPRSCADFAEMARTELALIDARPTVRRFAQELRWTQAYYRLARGF